MIDIKEELINEIKELLKSSCGCCKCGEIIHAIKEKGAKTLEDLEDLTDAGSSCGCCKCGETDIGEQKMELYLDEILKKFNKE